MSSSDAQKSDVHATTGDSATSPTHRQDTKTTRATPGDRSHSGERPKVHPEPLSPDTRIVSDDTDVGGPLIVQSGDPDLNPPRTPKDPFPTERTPEIDPPVKRSGE